MKLGLLAEELSQPTVFVDVDETLVKSTFGSITNRIKELGRYLESSKRELEKDPTSKIYNRTVPKAEKELEELKNLYNDNRIVEVEVGPEESYHSVARPSAEPFLKALSSKYPLCVFTSGDKDFQIEVLNKLGLIKYFKHVYSTRDNDVPQSQRFVLVDDLKAGMSGMTDKMKQLLGREDEGHWSATEGDQSGQEYHEPHLVTVEGFWGEKDTTPLTHYIPEIEKKMAAALS
jgi:hypothetical protein